MCHKIGFTCKFSPYPACPGQLQPAPGTTIWHQTFLPHLFLYFDSMPCHAIACIYHCNKLHRHSQSTKCILATRCNCKLLLSRLNLQFTEFHEEEEHRCHQGQIFGQSHNKDWCINSLPQSMYGMCVFVVCLSSSS